MKLIVVLIMSHLNAISAQEMSHQSLDEAKEKYQRVFELQSKEFLRSLERREKTARSHGKKDELDEVVRIRNEFIATGIFPASSPKEVLARIRAAQTELERRFEKAIAAFIKAGNDADAETLENERKAFFRPRNAVQHGGSYYVVFAEDCSWHAAYLRCKELKGHLVTIADSEENQFVAKISSEAGLSGVWIGLTDVKEEGHWEWVTGEKATYFQWHSWSPGDPEPDNYKNQDFAQMQSQRGGGWADTYNIDDQKHTRGFVCEWN